VAEVELTENTLVVHVRGMDRLWALESRLKISLSHAVGAESIRTSNRGGGRASGLRVPRCRE